MGSSGTTKFLKKRAPFYMAGAALLIVFVVPEITKSGMDDVIPWDTLDAPDRGVLERVLGYTGPNDTGISIKEAVAKKIESRYPQGNVYDHPSTNVLVAVTPAGAGAYVVAMDFQSYDDDLSFVWEVDGETLRGSNDVSKDVVDLVNFFD